MFADGRREAGNREKDRQEDHESHGCRMRQTGPGGKEGVEAVRWTRNFTRGSEAGIALVRKSGWHPARQYTIGRLEFGTFPLILSGVVDLSSGSSMR